MENEISLTDIEVTHVTRTTEELILEELLSHDLDFHDADSTYSTHNLHAFPAKFPPQIPKKFIKYLTEKNDLVLDPMMGSGTSLIEGIFLERRIFGFDIDPLAILMTKVKIEKSSASVLQEAGLKIVSNARSKVKREKYRLEERLNEKFDKETREFVNYWFSKETQLELIALIDEIYQVKDREIRRLLEVIFSSVIITKSGGVSLAFDLAHTRPHRAKIVFDSKGKLIIGRESNKKPSKRERFLTKKFDSPIDEFKNKLDRSIKKFDFDPIRKNHLCSFGSAEYLPLPDSCIDLIVTSPPYAANAIDYMRAHKFSLVWFDYSITSLGNLRSEYIGAESTSNFLFENLPNFSISVINKIREIDDRKALVLHRYFSELKRVLHEMFRVLKPGKTAILVVGSSVMRGVDTQTEKCLEEIGKEIGFIVPKIGIRDLDRNRRMMPISRSKNSESQIQQRMHQEYVIGFLKPKG